MARRRIAKVENALAPRCCPEDGTGEASAWLRECGTLLFLLQLQQTTPGPAIRPGYRAWEMRAVHSITARSAAVLCLACEEKG